MITHLTESKKLLVGLSVLITGVAFANLNSDKKITENKPIEAPTYTASGSMDKQTAIMIKKLLQSPDLTIEAVVQKPTKKNRESRDFVYTIKGKTNKRTALMLKSLLQNSKHLSIDANIIDKRMVLNQPAPQPSFQNFVTHYPEYTPFHYRGVPPTYIRGNTVWYPVKISERRIKPANPTAGITLNKADSDS